MNQITISNDILIPEVARNVAEGHTVTLPLKGNSMRPFLEDGRDKALLTMVGDIQVGDPVIAQTTDGRYVLHRIIRIDGDEITLRGDGNLGIEHCLRENVLCSVLGFYRKGRKTLDRCDGRKWRTYSWLWMRLYPIRRYLLAAYRRIWIRFFGPI